MRLVLSPDKLPFGCGSGRHWGKHSRHWGGIGGDPVDEGQVCWNGERFLFGSTKFPGVLVNMITKNESSPERVQECGFDPFISTLSRRGKK